MFTTLTTSVLPDISRSDRGNEKSKEKGKSTIFSSKN